MGNKFRGPAAAGGTAEAGLDSGLEGTGCEVGVVVAVAGLSAVEWGSKSASLVSENRLENDACSVLEFSDNFVARYEGKRDPVFEIELWVAFDHGEI